MLFCFGVSRILTRVILTWESSGASAKTIGALAAEARAVESASSVSCLGITSGGA